MSAQPKAKSTMQNLAKQLNLSETELLIAIKQMGLNPSEVDESWVSALEQHLKGTKPQQLHGKPPETPKQPESFSINDSDDFVDWEEVETELGETALSLVNELGLNQDAITQSDLAALRELALSNPVHQNLADHIGAVGSVQEGFTGEHIRQEFEKGLAIGEAGSVALLTGLLQSQLNGLEQAYNLQNAINSDFQKIITSQLEKLGNEGKGKPDKTVETLGKQATQAQKNSQRSSTIRTQKVDVIAIKNSLNK